MEKGIPGRVGRGDSAPADSVLLLRDAGDLRALSESRLLYSARPLAVRVPGMTAPEAEELSSRLNRYRSECGCSRGARWMAVGFVVTLAGLLAGYGVLTAAFLWRLPLAFLAAIVSAGAGKAVGIRAARRRLRSELDLLFADRPHHFQGSSIDAG